MTRGELYLVRKPGSRDPRRQRAFLVVSRTALIESRFSSVICAPVYSRHDGLSTQVAIGTAEGMKRESSVHCDELVSVPKVLLTHYVGRLNETKLVDVNHALARALGLE
jgi:mRNA interferase MazF